MKLPGISYISPVVRYDPDAKVVVVQHRNTQTGQVSRQFPSEEAVRDLRQDVVTGAKPAEAAPAPPPSKPAEPPERVSLKV